jgi:plastocyanin
MVRSHDTIIFFEKREKMKFAKLLAASALLIGLASCVGLAVLSAQSQQAAQSQPAARPAQIKIDNFSFTPQQLTIAQGTTIIWVNNDDVPHTVVATNKEFRSKALDTGEQFSFTFTKPGTYQYFCSVHPMMTGKVIVQ